MSSTTQAYLRMASRSARSPSAESFPDTSKGSCLPATICLSSDLMPALPACSACAGQCGNCALWLLQRRHEDSPRCANPPEDSTWHLGSLHCQQGHPKLKASCAQRGSWTHTQINYSSHSFLLNELAYHWCRSAEARLRGGQAQHRVSRPAADEAAAVRALAALGGGQGCPLSGAPLALLPRHAAVPLHRGPRLPAQRLPAALPRRALIALICGDAHRAVRRPVRVCPAAVCLIGLFYTRPLPPPCLQCLQAAGCHHRWTTLGLFKRFCALCVCGLSGLCSIFVPIELQHPQIRSLSENMAQ